MRGEGRGRLLRNHLVSGALLPLLMLIILAIPLAAQGRDGKTGRGYLIDGPQPVKGLPFFSPNAIPSLKGSYALASESEGSADLSHRPSLNLWYTKEALVFGDAWKKADFAGLEARSALISSYKSSSVLALREGRYTLFFVKDGSSSGDSDVETAVNKGFILAFEKKFQAFFQNAASDAELSFPAFVDF